jgi:hypothetical protein
VTARARRRDLDALQEVLAAEHAVVYGYGVAGANLAGRERRRAGRDRDAHRARRDELSALVEERGARPVTSAATYALPSPVRTAQDARVLATLLEERLGAVWADAVLGLTADLRALAVDGLRDAAVRAAVWRGGSVPFPGLPERG